MVEESNVTVVGYATFINIEDRYAASTFAVVMGKRYSKKTPRKTQEASIPVSAYPKNRVGNVWSKADVGGPAQYIFEPLRIVQATYTSRVHDCGVDGLESCCRVR